MQSTIFLSKTQVGQVSSDIWYRDWCTLYMLNQDQYGLL